MQSTPWAILLCKYSDDASEPYPRERFEEIFTSKGNGKFNMVDYFRDMSHGTLDLKGSRVFPDSDIGWYTLPHSRNEWAGTGTETYGRNAPLVWGQTAAAANGDILDGYHILVVLNVPTDVWGSPAGVVADDGRWDNGMTSLSVSILGQEMGHAYGLNHARIEGSTIDYKDPYDVMSTAAAYMAPHPVYTERDKRANLLFRIGPGLNAAAMSSTGWLDRTRVAQLESNKRNTVTLRPLHRLDLPGSLCAQVGDFFIEFRMNELWDREFSEPVVLIHDFFNGQSYLQVADSGTPGMHVGDVFSKGDVSDQPLLAHGFGIKVTVTAIDGGARTATLDVQHWVPERAVVGPGALIGGVANDGGGWFIVNGKVHEVSPRSPLLDIIKLAGEAQVGESLRQSRARDLIQVDAYSAIAELAAEQAARLGLRSPTGVPSTKEQH
jgi:hypothetical protein